MAHYLVLTQQASGANDTKQAVGEEAATAASEPCDVVVQEGTIAEPSGALPDSSVLSMEPATWPSTIDRQ